MAHEQEALRAHARHHVVYLGRQAADRGSSSRARPTRCSAQALATEQSWPPCVTYGTRGCPPGWTP